MKNQNKIIISMALVLILFSNMGMTCFASNGTKYAYSIGVNHAEADELEGDFTGNVQYAATCYGMMNGYRSYYQTTPSVAYLRSETNPNGVRKLASDVVFLNGHANRTCLVFGETLGSAVYYGYDAYDQDFQYAGLKSIGTMSTVDLISFVGCSTAEGTDNLASVAYAEGATTVVGFTNSITSRYDNGPRWLERYNDHLASGYTVQAAVNYAAAVYPNSDLSTYVKIYGNTSNTIINATSANATRLQMNIDKINVAISGMKNVEKVSAEKCNFYGLKNVILQLEDLYPDFSIDDYKVTVNMYSEDQKSGMIMFTYYIGSDIATNKAYVVSVKDGVATEVIPSGIINKDSAMLLRDLDVNEEALITAATLFEQQRTRIGLPATMESSNDIPNGSELVETRTKYYFDYTTNKLTYSETYFYRTPGGKGVYQDAQSTWEINY